MHSTPIESSGVGRVIVHHNGDWSGRIRITAPVPEEGKTSPLEAVIDDDLIVAIIDMKIVRAIVASFLRDLRIEQLEAASDDQILGIGG